MYTWIIVLGVFIFGIILFEGKTEAKSLREKARKKFWTEGMPMMKSQRKIIKKENESLIQKKNKK